MIEEQIAARYSKALFDLGKEKDNLFAFRDDLDKMWQTIKENNELKQVLYHHRILPDEKKRVICEIFAEVINIDVLNFIKLLIDKRREYFLELIINSYQERVNQEKKVLNLRVVTAVPLKEELKKKLKKKLTTLLDYNINLSTEVDPAIMGGIILKTKNHIIDGSIKNRIENLKERIEKIPVRELGV